MSQIQFDPYRLRQSRRNAFSAYRNRKLFIGELSDENSRDVVIRIDIPSDFNSAELRNRLIAFGPSGPMEDDRVLHVEILGWDASSYLIRLIRRGAVNADPGSGAQFVFRMIGGRQAALELVARFLIQKRLAVLLGGHDIEIRYLYFDGQVHRGGSEAEKSSRWESEEVIDFN